MTKKNSLQVILYTETYACNLTLNDHENCKSKETQLGCQNSHRFLQLI